jgi:hypothetical protein
MTSFKRFGFESKLVIHRVMNGSNTQKFIELWTNKKQTGESILVQSKGTKTISTTFRGMLICVIFRPGICKNIFLCSVLHWIIIRIKRFFSWVHACVHGADALTKFIQFPKSSTTFRGILFCVIFRPRDMQEYMLMFSIALEWK